jgi:pyruvate, water dikinase
VLLQNDKLIFVDNIPKFCTRFNPNTSTLQGNSAYPGRVQGVVQIVNSPTQISDFSSGNILVTVNGNPSIGVALKKAGAIVADEGGLACHAAILAREYKIPCVMGTCKGTKFLKNGDLVRIDATKGIVKIIENVK